MRKFIMLGSVAIFVSALFINAGCKQQVNKPPKAPEASAPAEAPQPVAEQPAAASEQAAPAAEQAAPPAEQQASAEQAAPEAELQHPAGH